MDREGATQKGGVRGERGQVARAGSSDLASHSAELDAERLIRRQGLNVVTDLQQARLAVVLAHEARRCIGPVQRSVLRVVLDDFMTQAHLRRQLAGDEHVRHVIRAAGEIAGVPVRSQKQREQDA